VKKINAHLRTNLSKEAAESLKQELLNLARQKVGE
jgi:hypothetical protein